MVEKWRRNGGGLEEHLVDQEVVRTKENEGVICGPASYKRNEREKGSVDQQILRRVE